MKSTLYDARQNSFSLLSLQRDTIGKEVGFWHKEIKSGKRTYWVSITQEKNGNYTVASMVYLPYEDGPNVQIKGHCEDMRQAVTLANETITHLTTDVTVKAR